MIEMVSMAELSYNTSYHTASKLTPYEVMFGQPHSLVPTYEIGTTKIELVDQCLQDRTRILSLLNTNLEEA